jgi:hypothetical protein
MRRKGISAGFAGEHDALKLSKESGVKYNVKFEWDPATRQEIRDYEENAHNQIP